MAWINEHCEDCLNELGKEYREVHEWLDEFCDSKRPQAKHRIHRHHEEGVEEARKLFGDEGAKAAEIHIKKDEGCVPEKKDLVRKYRPYKRSNEAPWQWDS